jgi:hypothetical protein
VNLRLAMVAAVVMLGGALLSHDAQTRVDPARRARSAELELLVMPSAETLRPASMGQSRLVADVLWVRSILEFGERFDRDPDEHWRVWFDQMLNAVAGLDPLRRSVYFYGATMLRINGGDKQSTRLFLLGAQRLPDDAYFPFSAGMTVYLTGGDKQVAARWVQEASDRGGPAWYGDLALKLREEGEGRSGARRFLLSELEHTQDEGQRAVLERQLRRLDSQEFSHRLTSLLVDWIEEGGEPIRAVDDMVRLGLLQEIPPEPTGGEWVVDPVGPEVLSAQELQARVDLAQRQGRGLLRWKRPPDDG